MFSDDFPCSYSIFEQEFPARGLERRIVTVVFINFTHSHLVHDLYLTIGQISGFIVPVN